MNKNIFLCAVPKCRDSLHIHYYGDSVCQNHWRKHCEGKINLKTIFGIKEEKKSEEEKVINKQIDLISEEVKSIEQKRIMEW